ncbi:hypothetical protein IBX73_08800 [candidate division WOR-3 bacterium]|nr:hypothetical protein [candidate division WOR-3 bacterium]
MEQCLRLALLLYMAAGVSLCGAFDFVMSQAIDLSGDGVVDSIRLSASPENGEFTLFVGASRVTRAFEGGESASGFVVVDIDKTDKYQEIAVHSPGPSDDDEYFLFWYDGALIHEMAYFGRWPEFYGNGIVNVDGWMGFWKKREKYVLNAETRKLEHVPQELYYVGVEANVRKSFPIYRTRTKSDIVANLSPNSACLIMVCDTSPAQPMENWYLIRSSSELVGWAPDIAIYENLDLPLAD